jgi:hypothetical protein
VVHLPRSVSRSGGVEGGDGSWLVGVELQLLLREAQGGSVADL